MRNLVIVLLLLGVAIDEGACKRGKIWKKVWPVIKEIIDTVSGRDVDSIDVNRDGQLSEDELVEAFGEQDAYRLLAYADTNGDSILEGDEIKRLADYISSNV